MSPDELRRIAARARETQIQDKTTREAAVAQEELKQHFECMWRNAKSAVASLPNTLKHAADVGQNSVEIFRETVERGSAPEQHFSAELGHPAKFYYPNRMEQYRYWYRTFEHRRKTLAERWSGQCNPRNGPCYPLPKVTKMPDYAQYVYDAITRTGVSVVWSIDYYHAAMTATWPW
jgi:hypothetical protein